jgi:WD40 repeat protein
LEAQQLLNGIRKQMSDKNWAGVLAAIKQFRNTHGQSDTMETARVELANLESIATRNDDWAKIPSGSEIRTIQAHKRGVGSVRFSSDGKLIASAGGWEDRLIRLWNSETGKELQSREGAGNGETVYFAAISPDGKSFAGVGAYQVTLWNATNGDEIRKFPSLSQSRHMAFSPDGKHLLGSGPVVRLVNIATGDEIRSYGTQSAACVAFAADGKNVLAAVNDGTIGRVKVWDTASGRELRTFTGHTSYVNLVAVSPDGRHALSKAKNEMKLWDIATCRETRSFEPPMEMCSDIAFSPDGKYVLAVANSVRIWETATGRAVQTIRGNAKSAMFSPDGRFILTGNSDGTIKLLKFSDDSAPRP